MSWRPSDDGEHEVETKFFARPLDSTCLAKGCVREYGHSSGDWPHAAWRLTPVVDGDWRPHELRRRGRIVRYDPRNVTITFNGVEIRGLGP